MITLFQINWELWDNRYRILLKMTAKLADLLLMLSKHFVQVFLYRQSSHLFFDPFYICLLKLDFISQVSDHNNQFFLSLHLDPPLLHNHGSAIPWSLVKFDVEHGWVNVKCLDYFIQGQDAPPNFCDCDGLHDLTAVSVYLLQAFLCICLLQLVEATVVHYQVLGFF